MSKDNYLYLLMEEFQKETSVPDPNDEWDRANTSTSRSFVGVSMTKPDDYKLSYESFVSDFHVEVGDTIYLVVAEYSNGDSFGHDYNCGCEVVSTHKTLQAAQEVCDAIHNEDCYVQKKGVYGDYLRVTASDGVEVNLYPPWRGYFNSLEDVTIIEGTVRNDDKRTTKKGGFLRC